MKDEMNKRSLLGALEGMDENDFTKNIIKPIFQSLGYHWSQFNGGPYEEGVDHIALKKNELDDSFYVVCIQSKKIKSSEKTKPRGELSDIIHQLRQCLMNPQRLPNGNLQVANEAYLAIPGTINPRLRNEIFGQLKYCGHEVKLLEGPKILDLLQKHAPEALEGLAGHPSFITENTDFLKGNIPLQEALFCKSEKNISDYYCDLEFFIGQKLERSLITNGFEKLEHSFECGEDELEWFGKADSDIFKLCGIRFIEKPFCDIKESYVKAFEQYSSQENINVKINFKSEGENLDNKISMFSERVMDAKYRRDITPAESEFILKTVDGWRARNVLTSVDEKYLVHIVGGKNLQSDIFDSIKKYEAYLECVIERPVVEISLSQNFINNLLKDKASFHLECLSKIKSGVADQLVVYEFLNNAEELIKIQNIVFSNDSPIYNIVEHDDFVSIENRISFPPSLVLDSGKDIAIFGGAGFGKTTTLQSYAAKCHKIPNKKCVFIELSRYKNVFCDYFNVGKGEVIETDALIKCILRINGCDVSKENIDELRRMLQTSPILLDGVDEIYGYVPNFIKAIKRFKLKNPKCQVIITSRDNAEYLSDIDFLGISLLPFNDEQLKRFIFGWCKNELLAKKLWRTIESKCIKDLVSNPLLATIASSLVEKGVELPNSEGALYKERLYLLTGKYDEFRKVNRQVTSPVILQDFAKEIAFIFHRYQVRTMQLKSLERIAVELLSKRYSSQAILTAIKELINPCNILLFDEIDGSVSFGHFRYQESLVAQLLSSKQYHELLDYLGLTFWRGAFSLLAEDVVVENILNECLRSDTFDESFCTTLKLMINVSPMSSNIKQGSLELLEMLMYPDQFYEFE
ncbi:hypothetical protein L2712_08585 [Shewanella marisflavi]|uniref:NACHT domain-containing protein n=1 Tax=Shewanella marisflavi TaxID=260364 RepID=UPI002010934B|nr:hypothetical protein [Shewanella marisflavi]MCL1041694.1 hypothetical protein [Shewanella marisflavi]